MRVGLAFLLLLAALTTAFAQQAGPVGLPEGAWRAQIYWVPLDIAGVRHLLYTRICRPPGDTPARVVVIAHGSPSEAATRPTMAPINCDSQVARWFLDRGFIVAASMRRGYGATGGAWAEGDGPCGSRDYTRSALESAHDIAATVNYVTGLPFARPQGAVVVGQSAGGWAAIGYNATPHPRVTAIISMAGGRGGHHQQQPNNNCQPDKLAEAAGRLAHGASTPMLWVYTANDSYFAPAIATAMHQAYTQSGGQAQLDQIGTYGSDGHRLFFGAGGSAIWGPLIERYLAGRPAS